MLPPALSFDAFADSARNNPHDFFACRSDLIARTIEDSPMKSGLYMLQEQIDQQRATMISPMHSLTDMMDKLDGKLLKLTELLAHWQTIIDLETTEAGGEARLPLERINVMLAAIAEMRARLAATTHG